MTVLLPPEILDFIIDHVHDDRAVLRSCSLTARALLPTSRHHLFHAVHLPDRHRCTAFAQLLESAPDVGYQVRTLSLVEGLQLEDSEDVPWVNANSPSLAGRLPNLEFLKVVGVKDVMSAKHPAARTCLLTRFSYLHSLLLSACVFESTSDLRDLLSSLPALTHLTLHDVWDPWDMAAGVRPEEDRSRRPRLRSLHLDSAPQPWILRWLLHEPASLENLDSLKIMYLSGVEVIDLVGRVLDVAGESMNSLWIRLRGPLQEREVADAVREHLARGLARSTRLEHLLLDTNLQYSTAPSFLACIPCIISYVVSPCLREIVLDLTALANDEVHRHHWHAIAQTLEQQRFKGLQALTFTTDNVGGGCPATDGMGRRTPEMVESENVARSSVTAALPTFGPRGRNILRFGAPLAFRERPWMDETVLYDMDKGF